MKREYWNGLAEKYEDEIFSVLENDSKGYVCGLIKKYGSPSKKVNDFGCGIGHFLEILSTNFGAVNAIDISYRFIEKAKSRFEHLENINYIIADLAEDNLKIPKTDFGLSVNMLIMPSLAVRLRIFEFMISRLKKDGILLMVVPSIESVMLTNFRLAQLNLRSGLKPAKALTTNFCNPQNYNKNLRHGIIPIDNVATKHYLKEELETMFESRKMSILDIRKIEYSWDTEFVSPPRWMEKPYPWDWLVLAQK
ncbi:MAG: class I SAM-dependent methyltransferase [Phycisphaerales bacterium]